MVRKRNNQKQLEQVNQFLSSIDLAKYREQYSKIKLVELDLPRNIHAIPLLYECYWDNRELLDYESFYNLYKKSLASELEHFRKEARFSKETFYLGLPARIYRTWASLLTQIQGGYAAAIIHHKVEMSSELDYRGIDMRIFPKEKEDRYINIQVKKATLSREVRVPKPITNRQKEKIINITYEITNS